jgi:hypothetical protein
MTASPDAVWAVLSDLRRLPDWLAFAASLEDVSGADATEGATYTVKPPRFYEPKTRWRISQVEQGRRQVHTSEMPILKDVSSTIEVGEREGSGARVRVRWRADPANLLGRAMRPMIQRQTQASWERSLERLDEIAGRGAAAGA